LPNFRLFGKLCVEKGVAEHVLDSIFARQGIRLNVKDGSMDGAIFS